MQDKVLKCYLPHEYRLNNAYSESSFYKHMFLEDIRNKILPISLRRDENNCKILLEHNKNDLNLIKSILSNFSKSGNEHKIDKLIKNAIEDIGRNLTWFGESIYEIYKESDKTTKIVSLIPVNFIDLKLFYIQIPPKDTKKRLFPKFINKKLLWKISIPKALEKNYSFKTILSSIDAFDSHMPKAIKNDLYQGNNISTYDTKRYEEKCFLFVNELTRDWGWDQRKWTANDDMTEYFITYKRFKFQSALAIFREHIISELNNLFLRLNVNAKIKVEKVLTFEEYEIFIERYLNGNMSHDEAYKILLNN